MPQAFDIEAKALGVTLEQDGDEWCAFLPATADGQDIGFPAPTEAEALDEVRAYQAIEASPLYSFEYIEAQDAYVVRFGSGFDEAVYEGKLLAQAYRDAQKAYAATVEASPPEPESASLAPTPKARKPRAPKAPPEAVEPTPEAAPPWEEPDPIPQPQSSGLAFIADLLDDIATILRKRGAPS